MNHAFHDADDDDTSTAVYIMMSALQGPCL
jgi:hypothetical protein